MLNEPPAATIGATTMSAQEPADVHLEEHADAAMQEVETEVQPEQSIHDEEEVKVAGKRAQEELDVAEQEHETADQMHEDCDDSEGGRPAFEDQ